MLSSNWRFTSLVTAYLLSVIGGVSQTANSASGLRITDFLAEDRDAAELDEEESTSPPLPPPFTYGRDIPSAKPPTTKAK